MNGWEEFEHWIAHIRARMEDGWAPVALVCLQAREDGDGAVDVCLDKDAAVLWPATLPQADRGPLLGRIAATYQANQVLRWPS